MNPDLAEPVSRCDCHSRRRKQGPLPLGAAQNPLSYNRKRSIAPLGGGLSRYMRTSVPRKGSQLRHKRVQKLFAMTNPSSGVWEIQERPVPARAVGRALHIWMDRPHQSYDCPRLKPRDSPAERRFAGKTCRAPRSRGPEIARRPGRRRFPWRTGPSACERRVRPSPRSWLSTGSWRGWSPGNWSTRRSPGACCR